MTFDLLDDILDVPPPKVDLDLCERIIHRLEADRFATEPLLAALAELRQYRDPPKSSPNGHAGYDATCFGCGKTFSVKRRPVPGRRPWCDTCKASGEPAAQRARDYRARRAE